MTSKTEDLLVPYLSAPVDDFVVARLEKALVERETRSALDVLGVGPVAPAYDCGSVINSLGPPPVWGGFVARIGDVRVIR